MKNTLHQLKTNCNLNSSTSNNTPYRVIHQHRTRLDNPIRGIIMLSIIPLLPLFLLSILLNLSAPLGGDAYATTTTLAVDNSNTVLELTLPSSVTLDLVPSSTNNYVSFGTSDLSILAGTNNPYGLTLTMSVPNTNLTNSSLTIVNDNTNNPNNIPLDSSNHPIIPTLSSGTTYTENTFTTNAWGYKLSTNTNYSSVPSSLELLNTDSASNAITTTLNLAAKVDSTRPAGVYSATLNFAVLAKSGVITDLTGTTWYFNNTLTPSATINNKRLTIDSGETFVFMSTDSSIVVRIGTRMIYQSSWGSSQYRTITITGGTDATNPDLITWLQANATQL